MFRNIDQNADNIYLNLAIGNTTSTPEVPASISVAYDNPILDRPSDYYATVVKFEIPLQALPLFVFPEVAPLIGVVQYNNRGNVTPIPALVPVAINAPSATGAVSPVTYIPSNDIVFSPTDPRYGYVYSYARYAQFLSVALEQAWILAGSPGGAGNYPYVSYNPADNAISIVMPKAFVGAATTVAGATGWTVCWDYGIQKTIPNFNVYFNSDPLFPTGRYDVNIGRLAVDTIYDLDVNDYIITQEYPTFDYLNSVRKIIVQTHSIPIRKEYFPPPLNVDNPGSSNTIPILADFQLNLDNTAGAQRGVALYEADLYRLVDLISDSPMSRVDLTLSWSDPFGEIRPLFLSQEDTVTIKLGFFNKKLFKDGVGQKI